MTDFEDDGVEELDIPTRETTKDERNWGLGVHLSAFAGYVIPVPFANVLAPLVVWQIKKESRFLDHQGREALNFQLTVMLGLIISIPLVFVFWLGVLTGAAILIADIVFTIIAALKANEGTWYTYPWSIKFVKQAPLPEN